MIKTVNGIDVFDVGYQQLFDWIESGVADDNPCWIGGDFLKGDYAIVYLPATFGVVGMPVAITGYTTLDDALRMVPASVVMPVEKGTRAWKLGFRHGLARHVEIWHIVDDADLWQTWEYEVGRAAVEAYGTDYHLYRSARCLADWERLPRVIYEIYEAGSETIYGVYNDIEDWREGLEMCVDLHGGHVMRFEELTAAEAGLYFVDDYSCLVDGTESHVVVRACIHFDE